MKHGSSKLQWSCHFVATELFCCRVSFAKESLLRKSDSHVTHIRRGAGRYLSVRLRRCSEVCVLRVMRVRVYISVCVSTCACTCVRVCVFVPVVCLHIYICCVFAYLHLLCVWSTIMLPYARVGGAACCTVMQCVAVCCSVLQCVAIC